MAEQPREAGFNASVADRGRRSAAVGSFQDAANRDRQDELIRGNRLSQSFGMVELNMVGPFKIGWRFIVVAIVDDNWCRGKPNALALREELPPYGDHDYVVHWKTIEELWTLSNKRAVVELLERHHYDRGSLRHLGNPERDIQVYVNTPGMEQL